MDIKRELEKYIKKNYRSDDDKKFKLGIFSIKNIFSEDYCEEEDSKDFASLSDIADKEYSDYECGSFSKRASFKKIKDYDIDVDDFINMYDDYSDFQTLLFKFIDDRNLKDADVYNKVHIDRRLFSKIRSDSSYHPSKETIILLGLSLELSEKEIVELLDSASYSLPKNNNYDLIIRFCFVKGIYKITEVNNLLEEYNCKLFSY